VDDIQSHSSIIFFFFWWGCVARMFMVRLKAAGKNGLCSPNLTWVYPPPPPPRPFSFGVVCFPPPPPSVGLWLGGCLIFTNRMSVTGGEGEKNAAPTIYLLSFVHSLFRKDIAVSHI